MEEVQYEFEFYLGFEEFREVKNARWKRLVHDLARLLRDDFNQDGEFKVEIEVTTETPEQSVVQVFSRLDEVQHQAVRDSYLKRSNLRPS